jgi:hypothetical protein
MITSSNPSGGSEFTFRSDLLLTARGGSTWALQVEFACLPCYPGNTLCSQRLEPLERAGIGAIQIPIFIYLFKRQITPGNNLPASVFWNIFSEPMPEASYVFNSMTMLSTHILTFYSCPPSCRPPWCGHLWSRAPRCAGDWCVGRRSAWCRLCWD